MLWAVPCILCGNGVAGIIHHSVARLYHDVEKARGTRSDCPILPLTAESPIAKLRINKTPVSEAASVIAWRRIPVRRILIPGAYLPGAVEALHLGLMATIGAEHVPLYHLPYTTYHLSSGHHLHLNGQRNGHHRNLKLEASESLLGVTCDTSAKYTKQTEEEPLDHPLDSNVDWAKIGEIAYPIVIDAIPLIRISIYHKNKKSKGDRRTVYMYGDPDLIESASAQVPHLSQKHRLCPAFPP